MEFFVVISFFICDDSSQAIIGSECPLNRTGGDVVLARRLSPLVRTLDMDVSWCGEGLPCCRPHIRKITYLFLCGNGYPLNPADFRERRVA
jgi:hypothetical protein